MALINGQTVLAVIPARGGSKRCPRKNVRPFRGKTLLLWSIEAALASRYIDKTAVSSEDYEVLARASPHVPVILRPAELATDDASNEDVLRHALSCVPSDWVVLLQPTSPLRTAEDIDACIERAQMGEACVSYNRATGYKNGAVYVARREWIEQHDFTHLGTMRYLMPEERSLDIDYEADFDR